MIKSIHGTCAGASVVLAPTQEGFWDVTVPPRPSGEYAVDLWAEDDAGNQSFFCSVLLTYDITQMCCRMEVLQIGSGWAAVCQVKTLAALSPIAVEVVRCQICGR